MTRNVRRRHIMLTAFLSFVAAASLAAQDVPAPAEHFGFEPGADRKLANWTQLTAYYDALARASSRVSVDTLGATTKDRPFVMLTITSPENHARLDELRTIQRRLADPRLVPEADEVERLLDAGRAVVLITHAIHSTEVGSAQAAAKLVHRLAASNDERVREILDNVVLLLIPSLNPDGTEWVSDWYTAHVGTDFEGTAPPWLYHFYVGHDNNRDWYAFTQVETQHTIQHAHNAWRPQIVHDIHQMGGTGARIFFPPYIDPVEPNVDPALVTALNQLGAYMAAELTAQGKPGVVINAIYDAFTPARAYSHYHGGVRILSETASARLATPVQMARGRVAGGREYDAATSSWKFPLPWEGGEWGLPAIVDYMESGALALLTNAAKNRRFWLENFYAIQRRAIKGWPEWPAAWVIPADRANRAGLAYVLRILTMGDVEVHAATAPFSVAGREFSAGTYVIPMSQPSASFAQTLLEVQKYPDLREYPGGPPKRPYDVTAHTLPLLMDVEAVAVEDWDGPAPPLSAAIPIQDWDFALPPALAGAEAPRIGLYKSWQEPMEAGWTRWVFDQHGLQYDTLKDARVRAGDLGRDYDVILLQSQEPRSIREGHPPGELPPEYTGGIGEEGEHALADFVREGGRIIAIEQATDFAIELLGLGVANAVEEMPARDFYVPGSILRLDIALNDRPLAQGVAPTTSAWFSGRSRAFDVSDPSIQIVARYGPDNPLQSGWILGPQHLAEKPALLEASVGDGSIVLFGFQPNYRGQSVATWPLLFNALAVARR